MNFCENIWCDILVCHPISCQCFNYQPRCSSSSCPHTWGWSGPMQRNPLRMSAGKTRPCPAWIAEGPVASTFLETSTQSSCAHGEEGNVKAVCGTHHNHCWQPGDRATHCFTIQWFPHDPCVMKTYYGWSTPQIIVVCWLHEQHEFHVPTYGKVQLIVRVGLYSMHAMCAFIFAPQAMLLILAHIVYVNLED